MITQERLKEILDYDKKTGKFFWREKRNNAVIIGMEAGTIEPNGYRRISVDGVRYQAHILAWLYEYGVMPNLLDHDDRDRDNNRIKNLVETTHSKNCRNRKLPSNNSSGKVGVHYWEQGGLWRATIGPKVIGLYTTKEQAIIARENKEIELEYHSNHGK